jgi:hypothetical protein
MKKNMGSTDRIIRALAAGIIATLFITQVITGYFGVILLVFAGILVLTSFFKFCPFYLPFGINTRHEISKLPLKKKKMGS